jgi:hypothetical protein
MAVEEWVHHLELRHEKKLWMKTGNNAVIAASGLKERNYASLKIHPFA